MKLDPSEILFHLGQKLTAGAKILCKRRESSSVQEQISEVFDFSNYPADFKRYAEIHWLALTQYRPQVFPGNVTLFRTHRPRLFDLDPEKLWGKLATGGIAVQIVSGTHEKILEEPHVKILANKLRENLGRPAFGTLAGNTAAVV